MVFLSSPPQPPPQLQFFNNPFTFQHAPTTPSPLRTSYNANSIIRPRMSTSNKPPHSLSSPISQSSNFWQDTDIENHPTAPNTDPHPSITAHAPFIFTFTAPVANATSNESSYANRSRTTTPTALLNTHAATRKHQNKQRFLDRIRTRRDDGFGRDERVLRADYLGERRKWEEEMRMRARREGEEEVADEEMVDEAEGGEDEGGDVSPTEEREIEALLELLERDDGGGGSGGGGDGDLERMTGASDGDSQEWDEVFMEVLSQQDQDQQLAHVEQGTWLPTHQRTDGGGQDENADVEMS